VVRKYFNFWKELHLADSATVSHLMLRRVIPVVLVQ